MDSATGTTSVPSRPGAAEAAAGTASSATSAAGRTAASTRPPSEERTRGDTGGYGSAIRFVPSETKPWLLLDAEHHAGQDVRGRQDLAGEGGLEAPQRHDPLDRRHVRLLQAAAHLRP